MIIVEKGNNAPLFAQLYDGRTDRYVRARVYDNSFTEIVGSPIAMTHVSNGLYKNNSLATSIVGFFFIQYEVFADNAYLILDRRYTLETEYLKVEDIQGKLDSVEQNVITEIESDINTAKSDIINIIDDSDGSAV